MVCLVPHRTNGRPRVIGGGGGGAEDAGAPSRQCATLTVPQ
jgi:hypothetical protein